MLRGGNCLSDLAMPRVEAFSCIFLCEEQNLLAVQTLGSQKREKLSLPGAEQGGTSKL